MIDNKLNKKSEYSFELRNEKNGKSAVFLMSEKNSIPENTLRPAEELTENEYISNPVVILSEAHQKPNIKSPTGSIIASPTKIFPEVMDAAPNCGMRIIKTDLKDEEMTKENISDLFKKIKKDIPTGGLYGKIIPRSLVEKIFINGSSALSEIINFNTKNELQNTYENGNFFSPIEHKMGNNPLDAIPSIITWIGKFRLNLLGATKSHFIYLSKISEIKDPEKAKLLDLKKGQYVFFMHTGSSIVGRYTASIYSPRKIKSFLQRSIISTLKILSPSKIKAILPKKESSSSSQIFSIEGESRQGKMLFSSLGAVNNYGFANRTLMTQSLSETINSFFGRNVGVDLLYDAPHVFLSKEKQGTETLWVHRNGANRSFGPSMMSKHPVFGLTGEPVLIAPFENTPGYIGVGTDENSLSYFSANHEIGKVKDLSISSEKYEGHAQNIIAEMEKNKLIKLVAIVKPIEVLTY